MSIKTYFLLLISACLLQTAYAQTDTTYYDVFHEKVENRAIASYYTLTTWRKNVEIQAEYYLSGVKKSYGMCKKIPKIYADGLQTSNIDSPDSTKVRHGTFIEWFESGEMKAQSSYVLGKLQGDLNTFYANQKPKRQDVYYLDTLKNGRCFDSLGNEIAYFPYQVNPEYKGGQDALYQFLAQNIVYPAAARNMGKQGTVYISFTVDKEGKVKRINTKSKLNEKIDKELIVESERMIKLMNKWIPGRLDGEIVNVRYTLPIKFKLE